MPRLQASGPITMAEINAEFRLGPNLGAYRGAQHDAGVFPDSNISMAHFYNRQRAFRVDHTTSGTEVWDLYLWTRAQGWDGVIPVLGTYRTRPNEVVIGTRNSHAMLIYNFPEGSEIVVVNAGYIIGRGGDGGFSAGLAREGGSGSPALYVRSAVTFHNVGVIGGGGGGGRGQDPSYQGGGGAGYGQPNGGLGAGPGQTFGTNTRAGNGGELGLPGTGSFDFDGNGPYGSGGAPGVAIDGAGFINWAVSGDIRGPII